MILQEIRDAPCRLREGRNATEPEPISMRHRRNHLAPYESKSQPTPPPQQKPLESHDPSPIPTKKLPGFARARARAEAEAAATGKQDDRVDIGKYPRRLHLPREPPPQCTRPDQGRRKTVSSDQPPPPPDLRKLVVPQST